MVDLIEIAAGFDIPLPSIIIEPLTGQGPYGPVYGPPAPVSAVVDQKRRLVRDRTGAEVVSETTVYVHRDTGCPPGSRITLPAGAKTTAITVAVRDADGNPAIPEHLEIACE